MVRMRWDGPLAVPLLGLAAAAVVLSGCRAERDPGEEMPAVDPDTAPRMMPQMPGMRMDPATMQRHAVELDTAVIEMRRHVQEMRQVPPEGWHGRMDEHVPHVSRMLGTMNRQMGEMGMGTRMSDEEMGAMMGLSGAEYRGMVQEMETLRREVEELQTAPEAVVRERMPEHLDRLERMVATMERTAAHMRGR